MFIACIIILMLNAGMDKANEFTDVAIDAVKVEALYLNDESTLSGSTIQRNITDLTEIDKNNWSSTDLNVPNSTPPSKISNINVREKYGKEKVYWRCPHNHSWSATIASRSHGGNNCLYCGSRKVGPENNLAVKYPALISEWHPTKNNKEPEDSFPYSHDSVWWLCLQCKHEWKVAIYNRTLGSSRCPNCAQKRNLSNQDISI